MRLGRKEINLHDRMCTPFSLCDKKGRPLVRLGCILDNTQRFDWALWISLITYSPPFWNSSVPYSFHWRTRSWANKLSAWSWEGQKEKNALQQQKNISSEQVSIFSFLWRCTLYSHPGIASHFLASAPQSLVSTVISDPVLSIAS